ncbi:MAG: NCS2 family permease [Oscillospiraceae bacterium]|nr:NCS2 family permease [Oscillospiraceae bacterium]
MDRFFRVTERGSTIRTEIVAGLTTFMAMAYILMVNAGMFAELGTVSYGAVYIATAISAVIGTVLIGLLANLPLAQASGMGLNAFFVYTVCFGFGLSYANALVLVLLDGIIFILLTVTGLRKIIFDAIPQGVKTAISAGIGLFIAFIGMQNAGIVVDDMATLVNLHSFNLLGGTTTWADIFPILITLIGVFAIGAMSYKKVKGAVLWGMLGAAVLYYVVGLITVPGFYASAIAPNLTSDFFGAFKDFASMSFLKVFTEGFDFSAYIAANGTLDFIIMALTTMLAFCMVDMFDTLGTLFGACSAGDMLDENGDIPNMNKAMLADAVATCCGAVCGTSTVTTFVESSAGVAEGGRTGLASMSTAFFFFVAMFLAPVAQLIPTYACAAALIYVGVLMMKNVRSINWDDPSVGVPAFMTVAMMPLTYNISYGIAFGLISHVLIKLFSGKVKEVNAATWVITILFGVMFFVSR